MMNQLTIITAADIEEAQRYNQTRYTPLDAQRINDTIGTLTALANETDALWNAVGVWMRYNVEYFNTLMARYTADESALVALWMDNPCGDAQTKTGGNEQWPLTTWKKSIIAHRKYQAELRAAWAAVKEQGLSVSWWAA